MIALLRNIRNLKLEIEELKKIKRRLSDSEQEKKIDAKISLLEDMLSAYKKITDEFVNGQYPDLGQAIKTFYYDAKEWSKVELDCNGQRSHDAYRMEIFRLCELWRIQ